MDKLELLQDVRSYVDKNFEPIRPLCSKAVGATVGIVHSFLNFGVQEKAADACEPPCAYAPIGGAGDFSMVLNRLEDSFSTLLIKYIRQKNMTNTEVYKEANLDRRLFSKIISNADYAPAKSTVLALVIALRLNLDEAATLLKSAGFAISHSSRVDLVVEYFIQKGGSQYNIFQINDVLQSLGLPQFGSKCWSSD